MTNRTISDPSPITIMQEIKSYLIEELCFWEEAPLPDLQKQFSRKTINNNTKREKPPTTLIHSPKETSDELSPLTEIITEEEAHSVKIPPKPFHHVENKTLLRWPLYPMTCDQLVLENLSLFATLIPNHLPFTPFPFHILLLSPSSEDQLFFENVARGITRMIAPTKILIHTSLAAIVKKLPSETIVLCSLNELHGIFPGASLHQPLSSETVTFLPIAPAQVYAQNPTLKRSLWNKLKYLHSPALLKS